MNGFDPDVLSRIEDAGLNASAPPQQRWIDGWLARTSPGKAKRARCINALAPGRLPVLRKLELASALYADAGLPLVVRLTPFSQPAGLDQSLEALGLAAFDDTRVMVAAVSSAAPAEPLPADVSLEPVASDRYAEIVGTLRGSPAAQIRAHAQRLATSPVPCHGFVMRGGGQPLACGQFALEADLVGLYDVFTAPAVRNRGLSRILCGQLLAQSAARGARTAYLQVDADNAPARALYRHLGFVDGYAYHYRAADPAAA